MNNRFDYHFEPSYGWINEPNGVCHYKGRFIWVEICECYIRNGGEASISLRLY